MRQQRLAPARLTVEDLLRLPYAAMDVGGNSPLHILLSALLRGCADTADAAGLKAALRVRVKLWLQELSTPTTVPIWVRDKCHYATLLLHCVDTGRWTPPFDARPQVSPLPSLPRHTIAHIKALVVKARDSSAIATVLQSFRDSAGSLAVVDDAPPSPRRVLFSGHGA